MYRLPKPEFAYFLSYFNDLATDLITSPTYHPIICGDFNYYFNATSNPLTIVCNIYVH